MKKEQEKEKKQEHGRNAYNTLGYIYIYISPTKLEEQDSAAPETE